MTGVRRGGVRSLSVDFALVGGLSLLVMLAFQVVFFINFFWSLRRGERAGRNPWRANTLEWTTESPPPHGNWAELPTVYRGPYEYSSPEVTEDFLPQARRLEGHRPAAAH